MLGDLKQYSVLLQFSLRLLLLLLRRIIVLRCIRFSVASPEWQNILDFSNLKINPHIPPWNPLYDLLMTFSSVHYCSQNHNKSVFVGLWCTIAVKSSVFHSDIEYGSGRKRKLMNFCLDLLFSAPASGLHHHYPSPDGDVRCRAGKRHYSPESYISW